MEQNVPVGTFSGVARMRLNIDFSPTRPQASARSLLLLAGAILALGGAAWGCFIEFEATQIANDRLHAARLKRAQERVVLTPVKTEAINRAIRQLNLPWDTLFAGIESRLNERVSLLSLEPDASTRVLRIQGESKSPEDMLDFIGSLDDQKFFGAATLVRHEIVESDRNKPIRFTAEALWRAE